MDHLLGDGVNIAPSKIVPWDLTKMHKLRQLQLIWYSIFERGGHYSLMNIVLPE